MTSPYGPIQFVVVAFDDLDRLRGDVDLGCPTAGAGDSVEAGTALGLMLFELPWAAPLRQAIVAAGGHLVRQGVLTEEAWLSITTRVPLDPAVVADDEARTLAAERTEAIGEAVQVLLQCGFLGREQAPSALAALLEHGVIDARSTRALIEAAHLVGQAG